MDYYPFNTKRAIIPKKHKTHQKLLKEMRARKHLRYIRYVKHQETPVFTEVWEYPQYLSCEPVDWWDIYDGTDWQPCGECSYCKGTPHLAELSGYEELTFEHVNSR